MPDRDPHGFSPAWLRAIGFATAAPDASEALRGLLGEAVPGCGARAGAVVEGEERRFRGVWGCEPSEIEALLQAGGPVDQALRRREPWEEEEIQLSLVSSASASGDAPENLLLVPLRLRAIVSGSLLLLYPPGPSPAAAQRESAHAFAGLVALVLENERLFEEARQALQMRDHFLMALNHELRTPASVLALTADLLRSGAFGELPEALEAALRDTERHIQEMVAVLRRVLDLGELESQAEPERDDIVQPREMVAELLRRVEPAAIRKGLSLALYVPRSLPALQTDAARFSRVLLYLFSNAIKYTSQGGIQVRIERAARRVGLGRQEPFLVVRVRDTGRGIPPGQLGRIFEPFTQVEEGARTESRTRGLGLGLPLARQLARSLGGDVTLESTLGKGTTATFYIPYTQQARG